MWEDFSEIGKQGRATNTRRKELKREGNEEVVGFDHMIFEPESNVF